MIWEWIDSPFLRIDWLTNSSGRYGNLIPPIMILFFIVLFPLMWCDISLLIAFLSGWSRLAERYRYDARIECEFFSFQSGKMGGVDFNSCLILGVSERGLLMSMLLPFRIGHPQLLIPWSDFHDVQENRSPIFGSYILASVAISQHRKESQRGSRDNLQY
ncbi:hypothetical protein Poly41_70530 [Novipirellula artificiosorum]|uniref:Uncharacterized protein n=1 Tax=Novipirellula artificiosorum TaxID=2528016 RepID=A0A5C6CSI9_9BACT|nr:hypothetical protein Poly41_70530 [Novipirellula artificiosorum]